MNRIYHPWWKWECYKSGFYNTTVDIDHDLAKEKYRDFLRNSQSFDVAIQEVFKQWPNSCEHFLTNPSINRIAWLGQASMCIMHKIPSMFRGGFKLLSPEEQDTANEVARKALEQWIQEKILKNT